MSLSSNIFIATSVLCLLVDFSFGTEHCPVVCECSQTKQTEFITKMKCVNRRLTEIDLKNKTFLVVPEHLQHLNLSKNRIIQLHISFINLPGLTKLILAENNIKMIEEGAFDHLHGLEVLDLSFNEIQIITKRMLAPLRNLVRLKLQNNKLTSLVFNIFSEQKSLTAVYLSENPWICDCNFAWFSEWVQNTTIKMTPPPKCQSPLQYFGLPLMRLTLECTDPELSPSNNQVVFAGDPLAIRCRSGWGAERVRWTWGDTDPEDRFAEVNVTDLTLPEHGWVESWLHIKSLMPEHSGNWICQQVAGRNRSAAVSVLVLSSSTRYCHDNKTSDNKGSYFWPSTVVGHSVEIPCAIERSGGPDAFALHFCSIDGVWENLNTSLCPYISETTKMLEQFSLENLTISNDISLLAKAKLLKNLTEHVNDTMDVVFVSKTVAMYALYVSNDRDLGSVLIDIISGLLQLQGNVLFEAENKAGACSKIIDTLEKLASKIPSFQYHSSLLAVEEFDVDGDRFSRISCVWRRIVSRETQQFHCATSVRLTLDSSSHEIEAAVEVPSSIFNVLDSSSRKLIVSMFANGNLFPDAGVLSTYKTRRVIGVSIADSDIGNLSEPVTVITQLTPGLAVSPAWWDKSLHQGNGGWTTDPCKSGTLAGNLLTFHCHKLGYYTLLQPDTSKERGFDSTFALAALHSGSCVILVCLTLPVVTYIFSQGGVQMSRRAKHAAVNTWISICLLCLLFSFGVFATKNVRTCELLGLTLHYFSMNVLLWMTVAANHMYKRLSRGTLDRTAVEIAGSIPVHKPILGLYLVGYGIGLIICGISGAVHLRDYANSSFCFLDTGPALSAVLVPTAILVIVLTVFYFLSLCVINNKDVNGQLSEGTQGTENVDLELLEDGTAPCAERQSARSVMTDSEDIEDTEHSPMIQLKAQVIILVLFLILWCSAGLAVTSDLHKLMPYQEIVGSSLYCLVSLIMGAFILYFYCVARSDVRARWGAWGRRRCCRSRSISDTRASLPLQVAPPTLLGNGCNRPPSVNSITTGRSSSSHRTKAVTELNNSERGDSSIGKPANNVNLVALHRQLYRSINSMPTYQEVAGHDWVDAFYNPRQSIVAKKFFKKQRRNRRNELGLRRRGDGGGTSEGEASHVCRTWRPSAESAVFLSSDMENNSEKIAPSLFGHGSKINNTNIHVGQSSRKRDSHSPKDPNVLSDGDSEKSSGKILLSRLVIGAEVEEAGPSSQLARLDEEPIAPDCRSIELQCSLGDSSDVPDGDDSFSQKIDNLRLQSDQSCTESPVSPPQYVTVLDPKYGVVKVTMNDYYQESHRLSLASTTGESVSDFQRGTLPSTPEELEDATKEEACSSIAQESLERLNISPGGSKESRELSGMDEGHPENTTEQSFTNDQFPPRQHDLISMPKSYTNRKRPIKRRSLPSSPEGRGGDPRLSLPSSPETAGQRSFFKQSPRLTIPPPPAEEFSPILPLEDQETSCAQWEKPSSPYPAVRKSEKRQLDGQRTPKSGTANNESPTDNDSQNFDDVKKETSV